MKETTAAQVNEQLANNKKIAILDVRTPEEVKTGKIPGAINIPLNLLEFRMNELDRSIEYTVVCQAGGRSAQAVQFLNSYGYDVVNMAGGMQAWNGPLA